MANKQLSDLETKMSEVFIDKAPKLPAGGKKFLVDVAPWLTLIGGIFSVLGVVGLLRWATSDVLDYANDLCNAYAVNSGACDDIGGSRFTVMIWLAIAVLAVQAVLYLRAFPGLRDRKKQGWNFVFYASLVSVVYSVVNVFTDYGSVGGFIVGLVFAAIGFWLLFQVREFYTGTKAAKDKVEPKAPAAQA